jgi:hypothetical protein
MGNVESGVQTLYYGFGIVTPQVPGHMNAIGVDPPSVEGCCGELTRAV